MELKKTAYGEIIDSLTQEQRIIVMAEVCRAFDQGKKKIISDLEDLKTWIGKYKESEGECLQKSPIPSKYTGRIQAAKTFEDKIDEMIFKHTGVIW